MNKSVGFRLLKQEEKIAEMYKYDVANEKYEKLKNVINIGYSELEENSDGEDLYETVHGDGGVWEYELDDTLSQNEQDMWGTSACILSCICYIIFRREKSNIPQDLEIVEENIPKFADFLENQFHDKGDISNFDEFWRTKMCY